MYKGREQADLSCQGFEQFKGKFRLVEIFVKFVKMQQSDSTVGNKLTGGREWLFFKDGKFGNEPRCSKTVDLYL